MELHLKRTAFCEYALEHIQEYSHRWEFWYGGAGSGKSYSIAQKIIVRCLTEKIKVLVCRKYGTTLRNTCFSLLKEICDFWKITSRIKIRETDMSFVFPNGSQIIMMGLDEETKLLSLNDVGTIWVEEAFEVSKDIVEQLNLRMRAEIENQQIILSWNPISQQHWLYDFVELNPPENSIKIHSTFKDNQFLSEEYIKTLKEMKNRNPAKARIYYFGKWGVNPEGLVFKENENWKTKVLVPQKLAEQGFEHRAGIDFGWVDPTTIVDTLYDRENKTIYVIGEFYKKGCQLSELADAIKEKHLEKTVIYADSAEPRSIDFLKSQRLNVRPSKKGKDSVKAGMMFLQDHTIILDNNCRFTREDFKNFSYIKSKQTGEYTEQTTHEWSHTIDALRYAYSDIYTNNKLSTLDKSVLGI